MIEALLHEIIDDDPDSYTMTQHEFVELNRNLVDTDPSDEVGWKPDREATSLAIKDLIMRHPTEFERLLKAHHEQGGLEFKSAWLDQVAANQIA